MNPHDPHIPRRRDVDPHLPSWWEWILDHNLLVGLLILAGVWAAGIWLVTR